MFFIATNTVFVYDRIFLWTDVILSLKKKAAVVHILQVMHCFKSFKVSLIKDIPLHIFRKLLFYI